MKFIVSGGGTGGHIFPALAIANEIKKQFPDAEFLFVGSKDRMEMEKVPLAGYKIEGLWISGINRAKLWKNYAFPFKLISSLYKARKIINKFKPDAVIGTGGFASGPVLYMAQKKGILTFIQEQNSYPGITNKLLAKNATKIYTAYDHLEKFFPVHKIIKTGNPIRKELFNTNVDIKKAFTSFQLNIHKKTILVIGGSLGARPINEAVEKLVDTIKNNNYQLLWQTGKNGYMKFKKYNADNIRVTEFVKNMSDAYAIADVIVSRAGAGTISELTLIGKPVILIPSPYVAEDHQTKNAQALVQNNAAVLINEKELDKQLMQQIDELFNNENKYKNLQKNIIKMALPDATKNIVKSIINEIKK